MNIRGVAAFFTRLFCPQNVTHLVRFPNVPPTPPYFDLRDSGCRELPCIVQIPSFPGDHHSGCAVVKQCTSN